MALEAQGIKCLGRAPRCFLKREFIENMKNNDKLLEVIRKIAIAKKEAKKVSNQIAAYEIDQQIRKLTYELVALYEESERQSASQQQAPYDTIL